MPNKKRKLNVFSVSFLLLLFLLMGNKSAAQNTTGLQSNQFYKVISFGEKNDFGTIDESVTWSIANSKKNIYTTLRGNEINNYVFQEPGEYDIIYNENKKHVGECDHAVFPSNFKIKVGEVKIDFDFSKVSFSEKIEKGRNYTNLMISVPVKITSKESSATKLPAPGLYITGLGVSLIAEPASKEIVLDGKTKILNYKVSGSVNQETYLMFDFYDFNDQVLTYNLHQIIK